MRIKNNKFNKRCVKIINDALDYIIIAVYYFKIPLYVRIVVKRFWTELTLVVRSTDFFRFFEPVDLHCQLTDLSGISRLFLTFLLKLIFEVFLALILKHNC